MFFGSMRIEYYGSKWMNIMLRLETIRDLLPEIYRFCKLGSSDDVFLHKHSVKAWGFVLWIFILYNLYPLFRWKA